VHIALMSPHGSVLAETQFIFNVTPASRVFPAGARAPAAGTSGFAMTCPAVATSRNANFLSEQGSRRRAELLVQTGDKRLAEGNVTAAREFYRRAAEMGWARAAFALGATYDPESPRAAMLGVSADPKQARCWYARAQELAGMEAASQGGN
jgi:TPR repeat protein